MSQIIRLAETYSTNSFLRNYLKDTKLEEGSVVITDKQTVGRGQAGNQWESEASKNLTFSLIIYPEVIPANMQFLISQITALSIKELLDNYISDVTVKWPNDIYWQQKKICGILIENDLMGREIYTSIIGIGLNVNQQIFMSDAPNPISLLNITGKTYDLDLLLNQFLSIFYAHYIELLKGEFHSIRTSYFDVLYRGRGYHLYQDDAGVFEACIQEIEPTGHLVLRRNNGVVKRYAFKEVSCV